MKRRFVSLVVCLLALTSLGSAMEKWQGYCSQGGVKVSMTSLGLSTGKFMASYPGCTITIYDTGTSNLSIIYSDDGVTPKSNPFVADTSTGLAFFYAANGTYDIQFSGGGLSAPFTLSGWLLNDPNDITTLTAQIFNNTFWAAHFPGASSTDKINNAVAACTAYNNASTGIGCTVIAEPTMACGEPNQVPDNVLLWDMRGCAQSQGLRVNIGVAAATIRSKLLLQDNYDLTTIGATTGGHGATSLYVLAYPDKANTSANTVSAINGTISTNTITGNMTQTLVGIEAEAFVRPSAGGGFTVNDARAFTANVDCTPTTGTLTCAQLVSIYGQAPTKGVGATVTNAFTARLEQPTAGTTENEALFVNGTVRINQRLAMGSNSAVSAGVGLAIYDPAMSGTIQFGMQVALQSTSAATNSSAGGVFRSDITAAITQSNNYGLYVQTPTIAGGGVISNWFGLYIENQPTVGTSACSLAMEGSTSGRACINPPVTGGVTSTLPSVAGVLAQVAGAQTFSGLQTFNSGINLNNVGITATGPIASATTASFSGQVTSTLATGTAPLVIASTTPVANLTTVPTTYDHSGTQQTGVHLVQDSCTLGTDCAVTLTGAAVYTSSTSYTCTCTDDTAAAACKVAQSSGSAFTITGTGTDAIRYVCIGK